MKKRASKILIIFFCIIMSYVMVHHIYDELYFDQFSGIFEGFIEIYLNNYISLDYFSSVPLFYPNVQIDPLLSTRVQGIAMTESYFPNFVIHFLILHYFTGLSPRILVVLPLGILFVPITYLSLIRAYVPIRNKHDYIFHILLGAYFIIYLSTTKFFGSYYVAPPAFLLALIIFLCLKRFFEEDNKRSPYYIIACISILSLAHTWHSMLMIVLIYILSVWMILTLLYSSAKFFTSLSDIYKTTSSEISFFRITSIFLITMILSLTFTHLWQSRYLEIFAKEANILDFLSRLLIQLFGGLPFPEPYAFNYRDLFWGEVHFISYLFILIFSSLILLVPIAVSTFELKHDRVSRPAIPLIYALSIIIAQIINVIGYYKSASINFPYVALFFPLFGVSLFVSLNKKYYKIKIMFISFLVMIIMLSLISVTSLYLTNEAGETSFTKYNDTESSFEWIYYHAEKDPSIIVDFNILGKYLSREAKISNPSIEYRDLAPNYYAILVGDAKMIAGYLKKSYIVIDQATMSKGFPITSLSSRAFLKPELDRINKCSNQNKLYEDSHISIFRFN